MPEDARQFFARQFARFLCETFVDAVHVARVFEGMHVTTAEKLMAGKHCPSGHWVGIAFGMFPAAAAAHLAVRFEDEPAPAPARMTLAESAAIARTRFATPGQSSTHRRPAGRRGGARGLTVAELPR